MLIRNGDVIFLALSQGARGGDGYAYIVLSA